MEERERERGMRGRRIVRVASIERSKGESKIVEAEACYLCRSEIEGANRSCSGASSIERRRFSNREGRTNRTNSRDDRRLREHRVKRR